MCRPSLTALSILALLLLVSTDPARAEAPDTLRIDLASGWYKRDWLRCRSRARLLPSTPDLLVVEADTVEVLFWQIPSVRGSGVALSPEPEWARRCERPPLDFGNQMQAWNASNKLLIDLHDFPGLQWRWRVDRLVDDVRTPGEYGFSARIGVTLASRDGRHIYEIAYVWSRSRPEEAVFVHETSHAGGLVKKKWHRIVAESGEDHLGEWVSEQRDLRADFRRLFPNSEPGYIIRLYVRYDSDFPDLPIAAYSDVRFLPPSP